MNNIKKIFNTTCLGYSKDFRKAYFQQHCLFEDGSTKIMYGTSTTLESGDISMSLLTEQQPNVARPEKIKETEKDET